MAHPHSKAPSWEILLPGKDHVLIQWLVRAGSAVRRGDTIATAIPKEHATTSSSTTEASPAAIKHKRPKKRKRTHSEADQSSEANTAPLASQQPQHHHAVPIVAPAAGLLRVGGLITGDSINPLQIGYIEPCPHPAIMEGLCAVCGESMGPPTKEQPAAPPTSPPLKPNMSQVTVSGGVTMIVSETEAQEMSVQTSKRLSQQKKLSLVLDLDHTLVHATADVRARGDYLSRPDVRTLILPVFMEQGQTMWMQHYLKLRPHVKEFLKEAQPLYEISVYTAGTRQYAEHVTMVLSRCVVGSTRDDEDLQRLRHSVMRAEYELDCNDADEENPPAAQPNDADEKEPPASQSNDTDEKKLPAKPNEADEKEPPAQPNEADEKKPSATEEQHTETNGNSAETTNGASPPRRKVTFGEPPVTSKTDKMTPERLKELRQELEDAEQLEQEALDVRQAIFGSRIVSRTDVGDLGRDVKSLERIFPGGGSMAVIVDDREDVWANAQDNSKQKGEPPENLLLVRPYHWKPFVGYADVNNAAGVDISGEATTTADEEDCQLLWTLDILTRAHKRFYGSMGKDRHDLTVPLLLKKMRQEVLSGCTLVFSGLVPLLLQNRDSSNGPRPAVVRYGESLGAKISESVNDQVTHVVASRDGTVKTNRARKVRGCVVVKVSWLMECVWTITRRDVKPHLLGPSSEAASSARTKPAIAASSSSEDDDDDDADFAAEMEAELME